MTPHPSVSATCASPASDAWTRCPPRALPALLEPGGGDTGPVWPGAHPLAPPHGPRPRAPSGRRAADDASVTPRPGAQAALAAVHRGGGRCGGRQGRWPHGAACESGHNGRRGRRRRLTGHRGRGPRATAKPPVVGLLQRGGAGVRRRLAHVPPRTITPRRQATMAPGPCRDTAADDRERRLDPGGDAPARGCHRRGAYARADDGAGVQAVPVQTRAGWWSLRRSGRRPQRGIAPAHWPLSVGGLALVHPVRRRGHA